MSLPWQSLLLAAVNNHGPVRSKAALKLATDGMPKSRRPYFPSDAFEQLVQSGHIDRIAEDLYDRAESPPAPPAARRPRLLLRATLDLLADMAREGLGVVLNAEQLTMTLDHIRILEERLVELDGDFCHGCGCTEHTPCEGGCSWVAESLCSACEGEA